MGFILLFCLLIVPFSWSKPSNNSIEDFINYINSQQSLWKAGINFPTEDIKSKLGFLGIHSDPNHQIPLKQHKVGKTVIPETFDSRTNWPECNDVIGNIRFQGMCGSCWVSPLFQKFLFTKFVTRLLLALK